MKSVIAALTSASILALSGAHAATIYATDVDWQNNGTVTDAQDRDTPSNSLGATDGKFLSLGLSNADGTNPGFAVFRFGDNEMIGAGVINLFEVTFNCTQAGDGSCTYNESVAVYYGTDYNFGSHDYSDLDDFSFAGEILNGDAQTGQSILVPGVFTYIALVDTTKSNYPGSWSTDGFDIDSISVSSDDITAETPAPAAAILMASGLLALRRKRNKA